MKRIAKLALKVVVPMIFIFVCLELLMVALDPYLFTNRFEYDPDMGFRGRAYFRTGPGVYGEGDDGTVTNQFGFNDRDYPLEKTPGTFRILVVGDSFSWAGGLKGNYTAMLEQMFETRDGSHKVDVVNTGYPSTQTGEQLIMLRKYGLQYNPDLVILGFFAGNDFVEADPNRKRLIVNGCYVDIDKRHEHLLFGRPVIAQSRLLLFLKQNYEIRKISTQAKKEAQEWAIATGQPAPTKNLPQEIFYNVEKTNLEFFKKKTSAERFGPNIDHIFRSITEMDDLLKARNIKFMVAIYPDVMQVSETQFKVLVTQRGLNPEDYDLNLAQERLKTFLESKQIPYVDLLESFRAEAPKRTLYLLNDSHWNKAGNEFAAEMLFKYLVKQPYDFNSAKQNP